MNWRVILAVVIALVVGAGGGALAEHQRLKNDSSKSASSSKNSKTTTTKKGAKTRGNPVVDWFGTKPTTACPALKSWNVAAVATYSALYQKVPWTTTKLKLQAELDATTASYTAMEKFANAHGKIALAALVAYEAKAKAALQSAPTQSEYFKADTALKTPNVKHSAAIVAAAAKKCTTA